jgi:succinate dehydrogenase hydrophobic anchor subunit
MRTVQSKASKRSTWLWFLQRVSSVGLIVVLLAHMIIWHYVDPSETINLLHVQVQLRSFLFALSETLLIGFVMFHALNGLRNVAYDYLPKPSTRRTISSFLLIFGVVGYVWLTFVIVNLLLAT